MTKAVRFDELILTPGMNKGDIEKFLSHLAVSCEVAPATQNQALGALLFLFRDVLQIRLDWLDDVVRAKKPKRLPVILTRQEVQAVMTHLFGLKWIAAMLLYGAGLRLMECLQLRVKDIDFGYRQITVRGGKGNRDRITVLPAAAETRLRNHLEEIWQQHEEDLKNDGGYAKLPSALAGKYPGAAREWGWQWVFPSHRPYKENVTGHLFRHHLFETVLQKAIRDGKPYVFEAAATVRFTPIKKWIAQGSGGHFVVRRLKDTGAMLTGKAISRLKAAAMRFQGKPYDVTFEWSDDRIYCSELVWKAYDRGLSIQIGNLQQMKDFNLSDPIVAQKLKERYGTRIPMNEPVISPEAIFISDRLATVMKK